MAVPASGNGDGTYGVIAAAAAGGSKVEARWRTWVWVPWRMHFGTNASPAVIPGPLDVVVAMEHPLHQHVRVLF